MSGSYVPWRRWLYRVVLCLELANPAPSEVAEVLRIIGAAGAENGTTCDQAEAALTALEVKCGLRTIDNATEQGDGAVSNL